MKYGNWQHDGAMTIAGKATLTAPTIGLLAMPPQSGEGEAYCYTYLAFEAVGPCDLCYQIGVTNPSDPAGVMPIWPWWGVCHIQDANMRRVVLPAGARTLVRVERHDVVDPFRPYPTDYLQPMRSWTMKLGPTGFAPQFVAQIINNAAQQATIYNPIFWSKAS